MTYLQPKGFLIEEYVVESFDGTTTNGTLGKVPASVARLDRGSGMQPNNQARAQTLATSNQRRARPVKKHASFRLMKKTNSREAYILEKTILETGNVELYELGKYKVNGEFRGKMLNISDTKYHLSLVEEDPYQSTYKERCEVPFKDRLQGWTFTEKTRLGGATYTIYHHEEDDLRSLVKIFEYIVYSCSKKSAPAGESSESSHESLELEATQTLMMMSSAKDEHYET